MYLKEAFRYQNFINSIFSQTCSYLSSDTVILKVTREHMRKKVNAEAEDEILDMSADRPVEYTANDLVRFMECMIAEREALTEAISKAKAVSPVDIDAEIANNKVRQQAVRVLTRMGGIRPAERMTRATGFKFNAEGNQVPYTYDVKEVSVIDFDRNVVKGISRELTDTCDKISTGIDKLMVELEVDFAPWYSVNDSYEDVVAAFLERSKNIKA